MINKIRFSKIIGIQLLVFVLSGLVFLAGCTDEPFGSGHGKPIDQSGVPEGLDRKSVV